MKLSEFIDHLKVQLEELGDMPIAFYCEEEERFTSFFAFVSMDPDKGKFMGFCDETTGKKYAENHKHKIEL